MGLRRGVESIACGRIRAAWAALEHAPCQRAGWPRRAACGPWGRRLRCGHPESGSGARMLDVAPAPRRGPAARPACACGGRALTPRLPPGRRFSGAGRNRRGAWCRRLGEPSNPKEPPMRPSPRLTVPSRRPAARLRLPRRPGAGAVEPVPDRRAEPLPPGSAALPARRRRPGDGHRGREHRADLLPHRRADRRADRGAAGGDQRTARVRRWRGDLQPGCGAGVGVCTSTNSPSSSMRVGPGRTSSGRLPVWSAATST